MPSRQRRPDRRVGRPPRVRVALVNDYEVVVKGVARMFDSYADRVEVVELDANVDVARPVDVALYDTFGQPQGGQQTVAELVDNPRVRRAAIYTWNLDRALVAAAQGQRIHGYLSKTLPAAELVEAIERIHAGEVVISPDHGPQVPLVAGDWPGRAEGLSAREAEVLALITQGLTNKDIAARTHVSPNSVKSYIRAAYQKIGVARRAQAVAWGVRHGMTPDRMRIVGD